MGCDRLFHLKDLPAVLLLTVATRPTPSMQGVGIVLGIVAWARAARVWTVYARRDRSATVRRVKADETKLTRWTSRSPRPQD
jgi:hypothetical protein